MTEPNLVRKIQTSFPLPGASAAPASGPSVEEKRVLQFLTAFAQTSSIPNNEISNTWGLVFQEIDRIDSDLDQWLGNLEPDDPQTQENDVLSSTISKTIDIIASLTRPAQQASKNVFTVTLLAAVHNLKEDVTIRLSNSTLTTLLYIYDAQTIIAALLNSTAKVKIDVDQMMASPISARGRSAFMLNAKVIAQRIKEQGFMLDWWMKLATKLSTNQIRRAFKILGLTKSKVLTPEDVDWCLRALSKAPNFELELIYIELAINTDRLAVAYSIVSRFMPQTKIILNASNEDREQFFRALYDSLGNGLHLQIKLWLVKELMCLAPPSFARTLSSSDNHLPVPLSLSRNPLKVSLLFHQILGLLKVRFSVLHSPLNEKQLCVIHLCGLFLEQVESQAHMLHFLRQKDLYGRQVSYLIKQHTELLLKIESVIRAEWNGPYSSNAPISLGSLTSMCSLPGITAKIGVSLPKTWNNIVKRYSTTSTPLQLSRFRHSPILKYTLHFLMAFVLTALCTASILEMVDSFRALPSPLPATPSTSELNASSVALHNLRVLVFCSLPLALCFPLQEIIDLAYWKKLKGKCPSLGSGGWQRFLNLTVLFLIVMAYVEIFPFTDLLLRILETDDTQYSLLKNSPSVLADTSLQVIFALLSALLWLKLLYMVRLNRLIGPLLKIIFHMSQDIIKFCLLLAIVLLSFASIGIVRFVVPPFFTFRSSIITLFGWMLGDFDYNDMKPEGVQGIIFLTIYLIINMVLLLNLLIGILSSTYAILQDQGVGLYLQALIDVQPQWAYHSDTSANLLTLRVPPLNFFSFLFLPFLMRLPSRSLRSLSRFLEGVNYIPVYLLTLSFIILIDVLVLPFVWLGLLLRSCSKKCSFGFTMFSIFCFPFFACFLSFVDVGVALFKLWRSAPIQAKETITRPKPLPIRKDDFALLLNILERDIESYEKEVPMSKVVKILREELPFSCSYPTLAKIVREIKGSSALELTPSQRVEVEIKSLRKKSSRLYTIPKSKVQQPPLSKSSKAGQIVDHNRFNALKQFLAANSITSPRGERLIYPGLLVCVVRDIQETRKTEEERGLHTCTSSNLSAKSIKGRSFARISQQIDEPTKAEESSVFFGVDSFNQESPSIYVDGERLAWLQSGPFIAIENEFRMQGPKPMKTVLKFLRSQKPCEYLNEARLVRSVRANKMGREPQIKVSRSHSFTRLFTRNFLSK